LFVTVNAANGKPFELFAQIGKAGSDVVAFTEAIARLISLALRCGVSIDEIVTQLEGIGGARSVGFGPNRIMSVPDAVGQALRPWPRLNQAALTLPAAALWSCAPTAAPAP
jgi:ribonucleoside-diphosphate reductase alpha chain